jgi:UDP-N-acetylmuramoylalanine-D-glutamate ligase
MLGLEGQNVLVLGAGVSGRSAAAFCARQGARVVLSDERADASGEALPAGIEARFGAPFPDPADYDLVVPSPACRRRATARARAACGATSSSRGARSPCRSSR